jgi:ubiquinone/menaquinone biosynthesis C-methylase UbiE
MRRVNPSVYTKKYYLTDCTGYGEFIKSHGNLLENRFQEVVRCLGSLIAGSRVLDIGCGRGEVALFCAKNGAISVGIDYSRDAIALAKFAQSKQPKIVKENTIFYLMDAKKLSFQNSYFDYIIVTDVVEHLYPEELDRVFGEIKRVLKKNGKVIIHTAPNKWFNDYFYRYYSYPIASIIVYIWNFFLKRSYSNIANPKDLRTDSHRIMHINEPTYFSLRNLFNKYNFQGSIVSTNITAKKPAVGIKDNIFNFLVFFHPLSKRFPFNIILGSDFISILTNKL